MTANQTLFASRLLRSSHSATFRFTHHRRRYLHLNKNPNLPCESLERASLEATKLATLGCRHKHLLAFRVKNIQVRSFLCEETVLGLNYHHNHCYNNNNRSSGHKVHDTSYGKITRDVRDLYLKLEQTQFTSRALNLMFISIKLSKCLRFEAL